MNRRAQITLTREEQTDFLEREKTIILSSIDRQGYPHSIAMWFVVEPDGTLAMTTYRKSQKVRNIERNPRVALLVESGQSYGELRGLLIRGLATIVDDQERTLKTMLQVHEKMTGGRPDAMDPRVRSQAAKRVRLEVTPERVASWDHSKIGS